MRGLGKLRNNSVLIHINYELHVVKICRLQSPLPTPCSVRTPYGRCCLALLLGVAVPVAGAQLGHQDTTTRSDTTFSSFIPGPPLSSPFNFFFAAHLV